MIISSMDFSSNACSEKCEGFLIKTEGERKIELELSIRNAGAAVKLTNKTHTVKEAIKAPARYNLSVHLYRK